jgi:hypothetical protein
MPDRVYISCDFGERELAEIQSLCQFLQTQKSIIEFAPQNSYGSYRIIEEAIERCDIFVAGVGLTYSCSTWLTHEITYAFTLNRSRMKKRPRIFAIRLSNYDKPTFIEKSPENYPVEWLDINNFSALFKD